MYGRKRYARKRPARKGVSKLVKAKPTAITTLAKAVKSIQNKMKAKTITLNYQQVYSRGLSGDVEVFPLSKYSAWSRIFGAGADDETGNAMIHKGFGLDMYLSLENTINEPDTTQFTIFLVSLKDQARGFAFNNTTGALSLSAGLDYAITGGIVMLNKKSFNIHAVKRKVLTNHGQALNLSSAQTQSGTDFRCYMKARPNAKITNQGGNWAGLDCSPDPSQNYYLLIFNDNSVLDLQNPAVRINVVHTIEQLA
jgi:hypothetical protein